MRCKIVGVARYTGEFEGKPFDSVRLYGEYTPPEMLDGVATCSAKCPAAAIPRVFGAVGAQTPDDLRALVGESCMLVTDKFQKITDFAIINGKEGS